MDDKQREHNIPSREQKEKKKTKMKMEGHCDEISYKDTKKREGEERM